MVDKGRYHKETSSSKEQSGGSDNVEKLRRQHRLDENVGDQRLSQNLELSGLMKLRKIYNLHPADIRAYNEECKIRYNERYTNVVRCPLSRAQDTGSGQVWETYTFVHATYQAWYQARLRGGNPGPPAACYHSEMLLDDGVFRVINATKRRPESIEFQDRKKYPEGLFDEEVQWGDTKPLAHSQVIYNQMRIAEQWAKEKGSYTGQFDLSKLEDKDIYEDTTRRMIEQFVKKGDKRIFRAEDSGYKATVGTPLGTGKWYLIHRHYENKAIVAVEMEIDDKGKYNIAYLIENKS